MKYLVDPEAEERSFWARVETEPMSGCWIWIGPIDGNGYGTFSYRRRWTKSHRWSYVKYVGLVPPGLELDHLCRNRSCCNHRHLQAVTHQENMRRSHFKRKTCCPVGHAYTSENTYIQPSNGSRICKICWKPGGTKGHRNRDKVACHMGHPLLGGNLVFHPNGSRQCRTCNLLRLHEHRTRKRESGGQISR